MSSPSLIRNITFGRAAAEKELDYLNSYFIATKAYLNAKENLLRKIFYVGHRGSGKSALFNQLAYEYGNNKNNLVLQIIPSEYSYDMFKELEHNFYDIKVAYGIAWKYAIIIHLLREVNQWFKDKPYTKKIRDDLKIIEKFLSENEYIKKDAKGLSILLDMLRKVSLSKANLKFKSLEVEFVKKEKEAEKELAKILSFDDVLQPMAALQRITLFHPIYLFIDELDSGFDNSKEAKNFMNGLFFAVYKLNIFQNIKIYVSLRQDMYNNLFGSIVDAEKIREDVEKLIWDKKHLSSLIAARILSSIPKDISNSIQTNEEALSLVFENGTFDYILSHTLYRPREVIDFCNYALSEYIRIQSLEHDPHKKINKEIVKEVEMEFSQGRLYDILAEYQYEYPDLRIILLAFENENEYYTTKEFREKLENILLANSNKFKNDQWLQEIDYDINKLIKILFKIGFIKVYVPTRGDYLAYYQINIFDFDKIEKLKINDIFSPALKCIDNIDLIRFQVS